jgi:3-hydroxybutyryl-CoA dehydrogenase
MMVKEVGVIGAGLMGCEIALVFAVAGHDVLLNERDRKSLERCLGRLRSLMEKGVPRGFFAEEEIEPTLARGVLAGAIEDRSILHEGDIRYTHPRFNAEN